MKLNKTVLVLLVILSVGYSVKLTGQAQEDASNYRKAQIQKAKSETIEYDVNTYSEYQKVKVIKYAVTITPNFQTKSLAGEAIIEINPLYDLPNVYLDAWNLNISNIKFKLYDYIDGVEVMSEILLTEHQYTNEKDLNEKMGGYLEITLDGLVTKDGELQNHVPKGQKFKLTIIYETDPYVVGLPSGFFFVDEEYSTTQQNAVLYTQNEPILARTWVPCFDTPSSKAAFQLTLIIPHKYKAFASCTANSVTNNNEWIFLNENDVSTFNVGFIVGVFEEKVIGSEPTAVTLIAENGLVEDFSEVVGDIETWINNIQSYIKEDYPYEAFQLVLMPPSYPFRGAQHGQLTFISPTIMSTGKTGEQAIIHEIASSYFGNLISAANWENLWINDGLATYLERIAYRNMVGIEYAMLDGLVGNDRLIADLNFIQKYNLDKSFTSLHPNLEGQNPENAYSQVSFEKGYQFMLFIEQIMGGQQKHTLAFLNDLIKVYKSSVISYLEFQDMLGDYIYTEFGPQDGEIIFQKIDWDAWIFGTGMAPFDVIADLDNNQYKLAKGMANKFIQFAGTSLPTGYEDILDSIDMINVFLDTLIYNIYQVDRRLVRTLDKYYSFGKFGDYEITSKWYAINLLTRYDLLSSEAAVKEIVSEIGRNEYIVPLYEAWRDAFGQNSAGQLLKKNMYFYHPSTIIQIDNIVFHAT